MFNVVYVWAKYIIFSGFNDSILSLAPSGMRLVGFDVTIIGQKYFTLPNAASLGQCHVVAIPLGRRYYSSLLAQVALA